MKSLLWVVECDGQSKCFDFSLYRWDDTGDAGVLASCYTFWISVIETTDVCFSFSAISKSYTSESSLAFSTFSSLLPKETAACL